jgi:hypothetical protein
MVRIIKYITRFGRKYCTCVTEIWGYVAVRVNTDVYWDVMPCTDVLVDEAALVIGLVTW